MPTKTKPKRTRRPRYKPLLDLPPLTPDEYTGLHQSIAVNGVLVPILVDSDGPRRRIIDGKYRKKIADELGYDCPEQVHQGDEEELRALARALNIARRHLNRDQKRQLVADQLRETPDRSDRLIGKMLGVDGKTVASVRAELEATADIPQFNRTVGLDGKTRRRPFFQGYNQPVTKANDIATPPGLCQFLFDLISPHYPAKVILDPCAGLNHALTRPWRGTAKKIIWYEIKRNRDFFKRQKALDDVELVLCNPPFCANPDGKELFPTKFLARILKIVPAGCPIVFFAPFHFVMNSRIRSNTYAGRENRYQWLRDACPPITSVIPLPQDVFSVDGSGPLVHSMILLFNMPKLRPTYFIPQEYLGS
jgi:hypothetical protein